MDGVIDGASGAGKTRGGCFFVLGRDLWERVWQAETGNRMTLALVWLVLLAGSGSGHARTRWSAKACETHLRIGKPRARKAIDELIAAGLVTRSASWTKLRPVYDLPGLDRDADPIFLPVALVTGLAGETPVLRRVRETGDPLALRMLIDLYGLVATDATHGVPIHAYRGGLVEAGEPDSAVAGAVGSWHLWSIRSGIFRLAGGSWTKAHCEAEAEEPWRSFWARITLLTRIGAMWEEGWLFDGQSLDAEPILPFGADDDSDSPDARAAAHAMTEAGVRLQERLPAARITDDGPGRIVPLLRHHQAPAYRQVLRMRVEPDTPGRRLAWKARCAAIAEADARYGRMLDEMLTGVPVGA